MADALSSPTLREAMSQIVGRQLGSVTFVQDYIQLAFDGPLLTTYTHPTVSLESKSLKWGEAGYRDALCGRIAHFVRHVDVDEQHVSLVFDDGAVISVSLLDKDYVGPEALMFSLDRNSGWIVI